MSLEDQHSQLMYRVEAERYSQRLRLSLNLAKTIEAQGPWAVANILARQGLAVFPVRGRQPLTEHGAYSASCDLAALGRMPGWARADGCGLATGAVNGLAVLDLDVRCRPVSLQQGDQEKSSHDDDSGVVVDGHAALATLGELPPTLTASSPSNNGRHFYFRYVNGAVSKDLAQGLQWFSDRKLVVVPPTQGRKWINQAEVAEAPDWLKKLAHTHYDGGILPGPLVVEPTFKGQKLFPHSSQQGWLSPLVYALLVREMRGATPQQQRRARKLYANLQLKKQGRNDCLNWTAFQFRELVHDGAISAEGVCKLLLSASRANGYLAKDGEEAVRLTIMSGLGIKEWPLEKAGHVEERLLAGARR